jgi:hypothetical protein
MLEEMSVGAEQQDYAINPLQKKGKNQPCTDNGMLNANNKYLVLIEPRAMRLPKQGLSAAASRSESGNVSAI